MARNTRRRATQGRNKKVLDFLNNVAENQEDGDDTHATNNERHLDTESVDHDHGDDQRQTRRSARLNKRTTARDATPIPEKNVPEPPDSPLFVPLNSDNGSEAEARDAADEEADEVDEVDEADEAEDEDERRIEEDGESVDSEEDGSIPDDVQQLRQEEKQAIALSQQEQEQVTASSPFSVVIDKEKDREEDATTTRATAIETARATANLIDLPQVVGAQEDEPQQEDDNDEEPISDDDFNMDDSRQDTGDAIRGLFDWEGEQPAKPVQRTRLVDRLETQPPQTSGLSSRKRRRASNDSTDLPDRTRRRREPHNQNGIAARPRTPLALSPADLEFASSPEMPNRTRRHRESPNRNIESTAARRSPVARGLQNVEVADWEATILEDETQDEVIVVAENIAYDDATKIQDLQGTWKRLINYCQKLKAIEVRRMRRYVTIEAIVERIADLLKDYKRMQRKRSRGRTIDPDTWKRTRQEVKYISEDAEKIRNVIVRRAKEGKDSNDLQAQADAVEYAELIVQQVMTSLCELALECLRTYYSEEDEWLLNGGFEAVLDIIDIVGQLDLTLISLHNCAMVVLSPYPGRPIRQELRSIRGSLARAEADEQRRGR